MSISTIIHLLKKEADIRRDMILSGSVPDMIEYRSALAALRAFDIAIDIAKQVESKDLGDIDDMDTDNA